jgi:iron-sulfur cluster assembly protein
VGPFYDGGNSKVATEYVYLIDERFVMITITDRAAEELRNKTEIEDGAIAIRLSITETGCSGNSYKMEHVFEESDSDDKFEQGGATLYVPKTQIMFLIGTEIDYNEDKFASGFVFNNPNADSACGCGESFSLNAQKSDN